MWNKCKVVMLPTNEKANNKYSPDELLLCINTETKNVLKFGNNSPFDILGGYFKPQHLYFLSDEEIKEGDWYVFDVGYVIGVDNSIRDYKTDNCKKIIATTDKSLFITKNIGYTYTNGKSEAFCHTNLPQPSQQFIEVFVKEYNKSNIITEVMVEYEEITKRYGSCSIGEGITMNVQQLKINPENTINIKPIKTSWNREENITLLKKAMDFAYHLTKSDNAEKKCDKWIEKNL